MDKTPVRYHVLHETTYDYGCNISLSQQQLHLSPRILAWQQIEEQCITIKPVPTWRRDGQDAFGNPVTWMAFHAPHDSLRISSVMAVAVMPHLPVDLESSLPWEEVRERLAYDASAPKPEDLDATRFLFESAHVRIKHELADYAADCFPPETPVLVGAQALMAKIFREFKFDPEATTVSTPVMEVLEKKRGVCQDFAHLMIACLRALGLSARYVSGYLLTRPPPGKPRLIGADASHAWVSVYAPGFGDNWVDFDPTNNLLPDTEHITVAIGRDFGDISPLRGIILGGGGAEPEVAVTVTPLDEEELLPELAGKAPAKAAEKVPKAPEADVEEA
ncbi:transglutaminase family protein [Quatrionicoccus australiensis]|uniref:transglutaminase family protein n=1 Tax=Quatrionicoccus australiensis TaxID=138118 RepID=UPI001CF866BE|nr:transglutaminase family protein [Quatrionicoccus australiensis]UCV16342.1 transglutaminase family protein [Quatrionicoccus australiensis]